METALISVRSQMIRSNEPMHITRIPLIGLPISHLHLWRVVGKKRKGSV